MSEINRKIFKRPENLGNGIVLYNHQNSFYGQKVLLALHEKNIFFTIYELDIANGEQYSSWFLEMNPKGEVPVLQDGSLIIPESGQILNYLENKFQGVKLVPRDDPKVSARIEYFNKLISKVPIGAISMGSFMHPEFCGTTKSPFIGPAKQTFLKSNENLSELLKDYAKLNPLNGETLLRKAIFQEKKKAIISDREEFLNLLKSVDSILTEVEEQLTNNENDFWLCSNDFTLADISLSLLLHRLNALGLEDYYWTNDKKRMIEKYFKQVGTRESFVKTMPTVLANLKIVWEKTPSPYKLSVSIVCLSSVILVASIMYKML